MSTLKPRSLNPRSKTPKMLSCIPPPLHHQSLALDFETQAHTNTLNPCLGFRNKGIHLHPSILQTPRILFLQRRSGILVASHTYHYQIHSSITSVARTRQSLPLLHLDRIRFEGVEHCAPECPIPSCPCIRYTVLRMFLSTRCPRLYMSYPPRTGI